MKRGQHISDAVDDHKLPSEANIHVCRGCRHQECVTQDKESGNGSDSSDGYRPAPPEYR